MTVSFLKLGLIGGLGIMASPMARYWPANGPARILRVHDRGNPDRAAKREAWIKNGATLVSDFASLVGAGDLDGVVVCCGKNGDDLPIIAEVAQLLSARKKPAFILHLSTVGTGFARAAAEYCQSQNISYANYPLTGGAKGAEAATMLILGCGDKNLFDRLSPALSLIGKPQYFSNRVDAGAEVKFISHLMVFGGLLGIGAGIAVHAESFQDGRIGGADQGAFFDFLNNGAGGTRQWDVAASLGVKQDVWDSAFALRYAPIDAIYTTQLCIDRNISRLATDQMIRLTLAFIYILRHGGELLSTQAIVREMAASRALPMDEFIANHYDPRLSAPDLLARCIGLLPPALQNAVALKIAPVDFANTDKRQLA